MVFVTETEDKLGHIWRNYKYACYFNGEKYNYSNVNDDKKLGNDDRKKNCLRSVIIL